MSEQPENLKIYDSSWESWLAMKKYGPASRWLRSLVLDACARVPQEDVLSIHDIGCGEGTNTVLLADRFPRAKVLGSDFSSSAVSMSKRFERVPRLRFIHDSDDRAADLPADLVSCLEVLEHVDDWEGYLGRLAESAQRFLLLSTPTGKMRPFEQNIGHLRNFDRGTIEAYLADAGWRPRSIAYAGMPFYSPMYRDLCQLTNAGDANFTRGEFGGSMRLISAIAFFSFRYLSTQKKYGDQFVGLFERQTG